LCGAWPEIVDEEDATEVVVLPKDKTHDGRDSKVVETYSRSVVMLRCKNLRTNNSTSREERKKKKLAK
jgi:predicted nuclease of predicted toxin-antitoxin system